MVCCLAQLIENIANKDPIAVSYLASSEEVLSYLQECWGVKRRTTAETLAFDGNSLDDNIINLWCVTIDPSNRCV
jgi:hypothetical protein